MTKEFNGFSDSATLIAARQLVEQAREFPQAEPNLRGLDAFFAEQSMPTRVEAAGVYFATSRLPEFQAGIAGALGRHLLKSALAAKPAPARPPTVPSAFPAPASRMLSASTATTEPSPGFSGETGSTDPQDARTQTSRSDPLLPSSFPATVNPDPFEGIEDFESGQFDEQDDYEIEPYELLPALDIALPKAPPSPEIIAAPLSLAEIKTMMGKASLMEPGARDAVSLRVQEAIGADSRFVFIAERWEAKAGLIKKAARASCARRGLRLEVDPPESLCDSAVCALFAIDPGDIPAPAPPEALAQPDFEAAIEARLGETLEAAMRRGALCGSWLAVVSGWGERSEMARNACAKLQGG